MKWRKSNTITMSCFWSILQYFPDWRFLQWCKVKLKFFRSNPSLFQDFFISNTWHYV